jgi:hypothetical protein
MSSMDRDGYLLQGEAFVSSTPLRSFAPMPIQPLVPWTLPRLAAATIAWLMTETMPVRSEPVTVTDRRV